MIVFDIISSYDLISSDQHTCLTLLPQIDGCKKSFLSFQDKIDTLESQNRELAETISNQDTRKIEKEKRSGKDEEEKKEKNGKKGEKIEKEESERKEKKEVESEVELAERLECLLSCLDRLVDIKGIR